MEKRPVLTGTVFKNLANVTQLPFFLLQMEQFVKVYFLIYDLALLEHLRKFKMKKSES